MPTMRCSHSAMNRVGTRVVFYAETATVDLDRLAAEWADLLDAQEIARFVGLRFGRDRRDYLAAHVLLRLGMKETWGRDHVLPPPADRSGWSLTHCEGFVACALSGEPDSAGGRDRAVGVDAEPLKSADRLRTMTETFVSPGDLGWLATDPSVRSKRLVEIWTVKEAVLKARGEGLTGTDGTAVLRALSCNPEGTVGEWTTLLVRHARTDDRVRAWVRCVGEHVLAVATLGTRDTVPRVSRLPLQSVVTGG